MIKDSDSLPEWDLVIVGAGPAGAVAALKMVGKGYKVALIDKEVFPRDKICGDALSPDVIRQLAWVLPTLAERFDRLEKKHEINCLQISAPNNTKLDLVSRSDKKLKGYVVSRLDFDNMLIDEVKSHSGIQLFEDTKIQEIVREGPFVKVKTTKGDFSSRMIIGADGNHSLVAKQLGGRRQIDRMHHCAALRQYYENVEWPEGDRHLELHLIEDVLPGGYLWVFPMTGNRANVGIGMPSHYVSKRKVNLKQVLAEQLKADTELGKRFVHAKPLEDVRGFGIPIGSKKYKLSGDNYLLAGDAACLVDPASGEGIANAIRSGRFAGEYAIAALEANQTDASFLAAYDKKIYNMMWDELRFSRFLQKLFSHKHFVNPAIRFFKNTKIGRRLLYLAFEETNLYGDWAKLSYYLKLLKPVKNS